MPRFRIVVVEPPKEFAEAAGLKLLMPTKEGRLAPTALPDGSLAFDVPFDLKADKAGILQPFGPTIEYHGDKRRFVYLEWWGETAEGYRPFRRLKVFFDTVRGFPNDPSGEYEIFIKGTDKKGGPACATAVVLPLGNQ